MAQQPLILVADDDELLRNLVQHRLSARSYEVVTADDGDAALRAAGALKPALIVLDAMMPRMDGFEVLRQLKADPAMAKIPVVMLTARKGESDVVGALQGGASDYLTKPFIPDELVVRIMRLVPVDRG